MPNGRVGAVGKFGGDSSRGELPTTVTGIDARVAAERANACLTRNETAMEPVFVHDGPPGREAWLVTTSHGGQPHRWIFVTPGFVYERPAFEPFDPELE